MARRPRSAKLETRAARLKLTIAKKPHKGPSVARGVHLDYRRNRTAGTWVARVSNGAGSYWTRAIGVADDHENADPEHGVFDFWQAQTAALALARGKDADSGRPGTVAEAIEHYATDLKANGGNPYNARLARTQLPPTILQKPIALLTARELRQWRDGLLASRMPATVNRIIVTLSAALELAASLDPRVGNREAWKTGLKKLAGADAGRARNVVLPEATIGRLVALAYAQNREFGLLIETIAVTGARRIQLARLTVADLQDARSDPRLMMPSAIKGKRNKRRIDRRPVPISPALAAKLRLAASGRPGDALLLLRPDGEPWRGNDPRAPFRAIVVAAGLDPAIVSPYSLRHSSITRQLLANVPTRVVAAGHDTSAQMIEAHYGAYITDHSDALSRRALPDFDAPAAAANVVPMGRRP
jgi:integrase